jgi:hypothetical protein
MFFFSSLITCMASLLSRLISRPRSQESTVPSPNDRIPNNGNLYCHDPTFRLSLEDLGNRNQAVCWPSKKDVLVAREVIH